MEVKILEDVLKANDSIAAENAKRFSGEKLFAINIMSSPGSGKTTILETTIRQIRERRKVGVIEGDIKTTLDAERLARYNIPVVQINTDRFGNACHLDANMVGKAFDRFAPGTSLDLLFIENVGNLVCPAGFKLGADRHVLVLSVTEGEDKPLKYPIIFRSSDLLLVNKMDLVPHLGIDMESLEKNIADVNPGMKVIYLSAKTGEGFTEWIEWLDGEIDRKKGL